LSDWGFHSTNTEHSGDYAKQQDYWSWMFQRNVPLSLSRVEKSQEIEINNLSPYHNPDDLNPQYEIYVLMAYQQQIICKTYAFWVLLYHTDIAPK